MLSGIWLDFCTRGLYLFLADRETVCSHLCKGERDKALISRTLHADNQTFTFESINCVCHGSSTDPAAGQNLLAPSPDAVKRDSAACAGGL
jgi:hypothetical protein